MIQRNIKTLTNDQFQFLSKFILAHAGINLSHNKRSMIESRLIPYMQKEGHQNWSSYLDGLKTTSNKNEIQKFVNCLTTNLTFFWREHTHYDFVEKKIIHDLLKDKDQNKSSKTIYIWSAAASFGQEAYTLAMLFEEFYKCRELQYLSQYRILATDIDTDVLSFCQNGIYKEADVEGKVPSIHKNKYMQKGTQNGKKVYAIREEIKSKVKFRQMNICQLNKDLGLSFQVIFLKNVLIYFDDNTVKLVVESMIKRLAPGGYLFLGMSELLKEVPRGVTYIGNSIYKKYD